MHPLLQIISLYLIIGYVMMNVNVFLQVRFLKMEPVHGTGMKVAGTVLWIGVTMMTLLYILFEYRKRSSSM